MTTVRWNDDMLDQLSQTVQQLTEATLKNEKQITSLGRTFEAIATQMAADREERNLVLQVISRQQDQHDRHQSEIRGLRLETRRMLNYLLNEKDADNEEEI